MLDSKEVKLHRIFLSGHSDWEAWKQNVRGRPLLSFSVRICLKFQYRVSSLSQCVLPWQIISSGRPCRSHIFSAECLTIPQKWGASRSSTLSLLIVGSMAKYICSVRYKHRVTKVLWRLSASSLSALFVSTCLRAPANLPRLCALLLTCKLWASNVMFEPSGRTVNCTVLHSRTSRF